MIEQHFLSFLLVLLDQVSQFSLNLLLSRLDIADCGQLSITRLDGAGQVRCLTFEMLPWYFRRCFLLLLPFMLM